MNSLQNPVIAYLTNHPHNHEGLNSSDGIGGNNRLPVFGRMKPVSVKKLRSKENRSTKYRNSEGRERGFPIEEKSRNDGEYCRNIPKNLERGEFFVAIEFHDPIPVVVHTKTQ
jgi:hypothetical protein